MFKPDKVSRHRPLSELPSKILELRRVVLFHPKQVCEEKPVVLLCVSQRRAKDGEEGQENDSVFSVLRMVPQ